MCVKTQNWTLLQQSVATVRIWWSELASGFGQGWKHRIALSLSLSLVLSPYGLTYSITYLNVYICVYINIRTYQMYIYNDLNIYIYILYMCLCACARASLSVWWLVTTDDALFNMLGVELPPPQGTLWRSENWTSLLEPESVRTQSNTATQWAPRNATTNLTLEIVAKACCWIQRLWLDEFNLLVAACTRMQYNEHLSTLQNCHILLYNLQICLWTPSFLKTAEPCKGRK